jgi:hypothetical protein
VSLTPVRYGIPNKEGTGWSDYLPYQKTLLDFILNERGKIDVDEWGRGTGKSSTIWDGGLGLGVKYPRLRTLAIAPAFKTLQDGIFSVIGDAEQVFRNEYGYSLIDKWNTSAQNPYIRLCNNSEFVFRLGSRIDDMRGGTFGQIIIEEGGYVEANSESWGAFLPCLRGYGPHMIHVGGTPSSPTSVLSLLTQYWQQGEEVPGSETLRRFTDSFSDPPETYDLFYSSATTMENPHYPRWVLEIARATMSPEMFDQEFNAKARKFTGLVCPEFDRAKHVKPFDTKRLANEPGWQIIELLDWGDSKAHRSTVAMRQLNPGRPPEIWVVGDEPLDDHTDEMILRKVAADKYRFGIPTFAAVVDFRPEKARRLAGLMLRPHDILVRFESRPERQGIVDTVDWLHRFLGLQDGTVPLHFTEEVAKHPSNRPGGRGGVVSLEEYRLTENSIKPGSFTNKPHDDNRTAHFCDLLRYLGMSLHRIGFSWPIVLPFAGQKPAAESGRRW